MRTIRLGDLCAIQIGRTPSRVRPEYWGGTNPWATISDLRDPVSNTRESITDLAVKTLKLRAVPAGTLLYSFKLTIGKMAVAACDLYTNEAIAALIPRSPEHLDSRYLRFALMTVDGGIGSVSAVKGRTLNSKSLAEIAVPWVPRPQQAVAARRLEADLSEAASLASANRTWLDTARQLRNDIVERTYGSLGSARPVALAHLGTLTDGDWILTADYAPRGVRLLQVGDVGRGSLIAKSDRWITPSRAAELGCTLLRRGDILISRMADPIGRACILPDLGYPTITAVDVTIFRPTPGVVDPEYITGFMNSRSWYGAVLARASGATRARISRTNLETLIVPVPPIAEQRRIAAELRERLATIDQMTRAIDAQLEAIQALPAALLRRAFAEIEAA